MEQALLRIGEELIDEETGEIIEQVEGEDRSNVTTADLPRICRAMAALDRRQGMIELYLKQEVERLKYSCESKLAALSKQRSFLESVAEGLFRATGEKKIDYPGLGTIRMGHTRESVDSSVYDGLSPEDQAVIQKEYAAMFRTKVIVSPDKKAIKKTITDDGDTVPGFTVAPKVEKFEFRAE